MTGKRPVIALILGAAVWADGRPSPTLLRRTRHAIDLLKSKQVEKIIASGGLGTYPPSEAKVMQDICIEAGVNSDAVILEDRARNTLENIRFSLALCPEAHVVIVTDHYHAPRAWLTARALGIKARVSCPAMHSTKRIRVLMSWLREAIALPFYALKLAALRISGRL